MRFANVVLAPMLGFLAAVACPGADADWVRFQDPSESAFTIEVPGGWRAEGGLFRASTLDVRPWTRAVSPDGNVQLLFGDSQAPTFIHPSPQMLAMGYSEGSWYSPGHGERFLMLPYIPGAAFAAGWGRSRFTLACPGLTLTRQRELPGASARLGQALGGEALGAQTLAGEAHFACELGFGKAVAYAFAATQLLSMNGQGMWSAKVLAGFVAPASRRDEAAAMLNRMVSSFRADPDWMRRTGAVAGDVSRIVTGTSAAISDTLKSSFEFRRTATDEAMAEGAEVRRGVYPYRDPETGDVRQVRNPKRYVWTRPDGTVLTTDADDPPTSDSRKMTYAGPRE